METVRIDKWLWAARFFKTRAMAARACDMGRVESNMQKAKPSRDVKPGDLLRVKTEAGEFVIEVLGLSAMRGPAVTAQALYSETEASREARLVAREMKKASQDFQTKPGKRDRRAIERLRGR